MGICDPIIVNCDTCFELTLPINNMNVQAGLTPASTLYFWIIDKFGKKYKDQIIIENDGSFNIVVSNFPQGILRQSGSFDTFVSSDVDGLVIVPLVFDLKSYECLILSINYSGDCPPPTPVDDCTIILNSIPGDLKNTCILPTYNFDDPDVFDNLTQEQIDDLTELLAQTNMKKTFTAGEAISGQNVVMISTDDVVIKFDPTNEANADLQVGLADNGANIGNPVVVILEGIIINPGWGLTTDGVYYAAPAGGITLTPPISGISLKIGVAVDPDTLLINFGESLLTI